VYPRGHKQNSRSTPRPLVTPKLVEILRVAAIKNIAILLNPTNPANRDLMSQKFPAQASSIGVTLRPIEFKGAKELDATFAALGHQPSEALVVMSDAVFMICASESPRWRCNFLS
jgi:hypothetical protein